MARQDKNNPHSNPAQSLAATTALAAPEAHERVTAQSSLIIPAPLELPKLSRRSFIRLSVAAAALAVTPHARMIVAAAGRAPLHTAQAQAEASQAGFTVDEASPIGKKWLKLGGQPVVGAPISAVTSSPDGSAQYQMFEHGVIIYSNDWGAMLVSQAIFLKWLSLNALTNDLGQNLLSYVGFPTQDYSADSGSETAHFERGAIVIQPITTAAYVVHGFINEHFLLVRDIIGLPVGEAVSAADGGWFQAFQGGDIYWRSDTGARAVYGAIRQRWLDLGGAGGPLGYPLTDEQSVTRDGVEIGRASRFQGGTIYFSVATGAWEVMGALLHDYENLYAGPIGWLGFPISGQATSVPAGNLFNTFQQGVLVTYNRAESHGVLAFNKLIFRITRLQGNTDDCVAGICGSADLFVRPHIQTSTGLDFGGRIPAGGDFDGGAAVDVAYDLTPGAQVVRGDLSVTIAIEGWDADDLSGDDRLGTVHALYSVDNWWGFFDGGTHSDSTSDGSFDATFSMESPLPFNPLKFRQQMFWSFHNFDTGELTYNQFAATFTDVDTDEAVWRHPFNALFYVAAYKHLATSGNCFGMSLESIFAQANRSLYSEPIIRFWPDTQDGRRLDPSNPLHQQTINELNIKHGYQIGAEHLDWFLSKFISKQDHNPVQCFIDSREAFKQGDYPVLSLSNGYLSFNGHTVRPYRWDDSNPQNWVISIANPNSPSGSVQDDNDPSCRIEINPATNTFTYQHEAGDIWSGSSWSGGRMFYSPFRHLSDQPRTPFWEALALIVGGTILLLGANAQTAQITDATNRTLYDPTLGTSPTRWDQIRQDDATRIPNITRVPLSNAGETGVVPIEMHYARSVGATYQHAVVPAPGVAAGTPYEWVLQSALLSARVVIPGTPGIADILTASELGTATKAVAITLAATAPNKQIVWTLAGPDKQRWIELSNLTMLPSQSITARLSNSGYEIGFENTGPATTAELRVRAGLGATPVLVGVISIPSGQSPLFAFDAPHTTLTYTGGSLGQNGWLISPVMITLAAQEYSGKGLAYSEYSVDGLTWTRYTSPFAYAAQGVTTIYYRSRDNDGNQEGARTQVFKIDTQPPQSTLAIGQPLYSSGPPPVIPSVTPLTLKGSDAASGVQSVAYRFFLRGHTPPDYTIVAGDSAQFQLLGTDGLYQIDLLTTDGAGLTDTRNQFIRLSNTRVLNGLQVLYTFEEGSGTIIHDVSGVGTPIDLALTDSDRAQWRAGGLAITAPTHLASSSPATKLINAIRVTNELSIEAWITPADVHQQTLARIVTLSNDRVRRNIELLQERDEGHTKASYTIRLRTSETSRDGKPELETSRGISQPISQHVLYTRDALGVARIYVDGIQRAHIDRDGDFTTWDDGYQLVLANVLTGDRPWLGNYDLVAIYSRALSPAEVRQNFQGGADGAASVGVHAELESRYTFEEHGGSTVHDVSTHGKPLDLRIANRSATEWIAGGLVIQSNTFLMSKNAVHKIIDQATVTSEITIETWLRPASVKPASAGTIFSVTTDAGTRLITLTQNAGNNHHPSNYAVEIRTTTSVDGLSLQTLDGAVTTDLTHVVFTRDAAGMARLFINGVLAAVRVKDGDFTNWDTAARLILASERSGSHPWLGEYQAVGVYTRAISPAEVNTRFHDGPNSSQEW